MNDEQHNSEIENDDSAHGIQDVAGQGSHATVGSDSLANGVPHNIQGDDRLTRNTNDDIEETMIATQPTMFIAAQHTENISKPHRIGLRSYNTGTVHPQAQPGKGVKPAGGMMHAGLRGSQGVSTACDARVMNGRLWDPLWKVPLYALLKGQLTYDINDGRFK